MQKIAKKFVEVMRECSHVTKHGLASVVTPNLLNMQQVTTAKGNVEQLATVEVVITLIDSVYCH